MEEDSLTFVKGSLFCSIQATQKRHLFYSINSNINIIQRPLTNITRTMSDQISGHPVAQASQHMNSTIRSVSLVTHISDHAYSPKKDNNKVIISPGMT
jgi:hypothetical protein